MTTELVVQPRVQEVLVILVALRSLVETKVEIRTTKVVVTSRVCRRDKGESR